MAASEVRINQKWNFSMKIYWALFKSGSNDIFYYGHPFWFGFTSDFNSSAQVLTLWAMKNNKSSAVV